MPPPRPSLSVHDVHQIAHLARLELTDAEIAHVQAQLNEFFKFITQMQTVDTQGIEPLTHPVTHEALRLRDDRVTELPEPDLYQKCAPEVCNGLYRVPKVIE